MSLPIRQRAGCVCPWIGAILVLLLLAASPVFAANRQAQERKARKACLNGDYPAGVAILSDLFLDTKNPTYLFNQGRCFELNRRFEEAIGRFEEYLRLVDSSGSRATASDRAEAEKHIASCRQSMAQERPTMPVPVTPPPAAVTQSANSFPAPLTPDVVQPQPQSTTVQDRKGLRIAGIVTASAGAAALVSGVLLNMKSNSMVSDMQGSVGAYTPGKESDQKSYRTLAWVSYGVGGTCLVAGAVMYGLGLKRGSSPSDGRLAILPALAPGQTGALLAGAF